MLSSNRRQRQPLIVVCDADSALGLQPAQVIKLVGYALAVDAALDAGLKIVAISSAGAGNGRGWMCKGGAGVVDVAAV